MLLQTIYRVQRKLNPEQRIEGARYPDGTQAAVFARSGGEAARELWGVSSIIGETYVKPRSEMLIWNICICNPQLMRLSTSLSDC